MSRFSFLQLRTARPSFVARPVARNLEVVGEVVGDLDAATPLVEGEVGVEDTRASIRDVEGATLDG